MMNPFRPVLASRVNGIGVEILGFSALMPVPSSLVHTCMIVCKLSRFPEKN